MSLHTTIKLTGRLSIKKYDKNNKLIYETEVPNLVVTAGKNLLASRISSDDDDSIGYMAIGDNTTTVNLSQTGLLNQVNRVAATSSVSGANVTFTSTFGPQSTSLGYIDVVEAGLFNASGTGGTMLCRTTFPPINKVDTDSIVISWVVTIG